MIFSWSLATGVLCLRFKILFKSSVLADFPGVAPAAETEKKPAHPFLVGTEARIPLGSIHVPGAILAPAGLPPWLGVGGIHSNCPTRDIH